MVGEPYSILLRNMNDFIHKIWEGNVTTEDLTVGLETLSRDMDMFRKKVERKELEREEIERKEELRREVVEKEREVEREEMEAMSQLMDMIMEKEMERKVAEKKMAERKKRIMDVLGKELERKEMEWEEIERKEQARRLLVKKRREVRRKEMEAVVYIMDLLKICGGNKEDGDTGRTVTDWEGITRRKELGKEESARKKMERKEIETREMGVMKGKEGKEGKELRKMGMERKEVEKKKVMVNKGRDMGRNVTERKDPVGEKSERKEIERMDLVKKKSERKELEGNKKERKENDKGVMMIQEDSTNSRSQEGISSSSELDWKLVRGGRRRRKEPSKVLCGADEGMDNNNPVGRCSLIGQQQIEGRTPRLPFPAVMIVGSTDGFSYPTAMRKVRECIDLEALGIGIGSTHIRRTANGGLLIEVHEEDACSKVEVLGKRIREVLGDLARVSCLIGKKKKGEVYVSGFDESVTAEEIARAVSGSGGCPVMDVRVGPIRSLRNGLGMARVQLPAEAVASLVDTRSVRLGWMVARVGVLEPRPLQCYRCWEYGHVRSECHSLADRQDACFNCGQAGHMVSMCRNTAYCVLCHEAGAESTHRTGGPFCRARRTDRRC